jgi:hypothetical protein
LRSVVGLLAHGSVVVRIVKHQVQGFTLHLRNDRLDDVRRSEFEHANGKLGLHCGEKRLKRRPARVRARKTGNFEFAGDRLEGIGWKFLIRWTFRNPNLGLPWPPGTHTRHGLVNLRRDQLTL